MQNELRKFYCQKCVTPNSRPRLQFNKDQVCNACLWHERKQTEIDWTLRWNHLQAICDHYRRNEPFDCIVPCSGGKDGSYVAWRLKHDLGMHPLCVTFAPPLPTKIGQRNLQNFINSGFDHLLITPNPETYRQMCRWYFLNQGRPKWPFVMGISTALVRIAKQFDIRLMVYGEQGEVEYGGKAETETLQKLDQKFLKEIYYEGNDPSEWGFWWKLPAQEDLNQLHVTWWSLFEDWDPETHAKHVKQNCGFEMLVGGSIGTFTNYAQLDDALQDLHGFFMWLKFGFGRCTSDASIEIRRGRMTREQGVEVVRKLDGTFPLEYLDLYLSFLNVTEEEFWLVMDKYANSKLLQMNDDPARPWILREPCV